MRLPQVAQLEVNEEQETQDNIIVHRTLLWDFANGEFFLKDGKTVEIEGKEYLQIWIQKALLTIKDSLIYQGTGYGSEHHSLVGKNFKPSFTAEELKRMIRNSLLFNAAIRNVERFEFVQEGSMVLIKFMVRSIFGDVEIVKYDREIVPEKFWILNKDAFDLYGRNYVWMDNSTWEDDNIWKD